MFSKIFIEKDILNHKRVERILKFFPQSKQVTLSNYRDVFETVKKPYLQKRDNLQLFLAQKKGKLVKQAPDAYGLEASKEPHYYFIQAINCIYECEYCYLQGYFNSPDIVLFINFEDMASDIKKVIEANKDTQKIWFHSGEFADSLALSHLTGEIEFFYDFFQKHPQAFWEIRTKSCNIKSFQNLKPLENIFISFSLSPEKQVKNYDHKTAPLKQRLKAMKTLHERGFKVGAHFDPIIPTADYFEAYQELFDETNNSVPLKDLSYISLGAVRYSQKTFLEVKRNYPDSSLHAFDMVKGFDKKIRLPKITRSEVLARLYEEILHKGASPQTTYLCME